MFAVRWVKQCDVSFSVVLCFVVLVNGRFVFLFVVISAFFEGIFFMVVLLF